MQLLLYFSSSLLALTNKLLLLRLLPPNPAAGGAGAGTGATAGGPLLSCSPHTVRVRRNTAPGRADLQQVVGLRRLRRHRDQAVAVQLLHLLLLLGERFLEALILWSLSKLFRIVLAPFRFVLSTVSGTKNAYIVDDKRSSILLGGDCCLTCWDEGDCYC